MKGKYLITGRQGSGKTTVCRLLQKSGYSAYDIDHTDGLAVLRDRETNERYTWGELPNHTPGDVIDWNRYLYETDPVVLRKLLDSDDLVFISGGGGNLRELSSWFNKVFVFTVDRETATKRLRQHETKSHHLQGEIDRILENHEEKQRKVVKMSSNAIEIDATGSPESIIDTMFGIITSNS